MYINLRSDAVPCQHYRARTVPFQWRDAVEAQLSSMVSKGVIEKVLVGESLTWCHLTVVLPKKSSAEPQITVYLTGLNKYVELPAYPIRVPSEVVASVPPGMKYFTTLDSRRCYGTDFGRRWSTTAEVTKRWRDWKRSKSWWKTSSSTTPTWRAMSIVFER